MVNNVKIVGGALDKMRHNLIACCSVIVLKLQPPVKVHLIAFHSF